jgi:murein DD-endopeptidase MepM/ murein hydrolase activator NlpD
MNNINNTDSHLNAKKLISSQRDFNKHIAKPKRQVNISNILTRNNSYILSGLIIILILTWVFLGAHNKKHTKKNNHRYQSQEIGLPDIKKFSESETNEETTVNNTNQDNLTPSEDLNHKTKIITVSKNDNLTNIFRALKISNEALHKIINNQNINNYMKKIQPGQKLEITYDYTDGQLIKIIYPLDKLNIFKIEKDPDNSDALIGHTERLQTTEKETFATLHINSSLFEDAQKQKLNIDLVLQIINIFAWDIDFAQDLRSGDSVEILYKEYFMNGESHSNGPILAINFHNNGKTYSAIRFEHGDHADYYTPEGLSMHKTFIRTPVKFTRISSKFSLGRNHPLLHRIRAHRGVDYAAPTGTPIKAAGDGRIVHYGRKGGYGKTAIIQHGEKYTTLYAHMSKYNSKLQTGSFVKQGEVIGYVGQTGLATGPHLHYEFRVNGEHKNPLTVPLPKANPIDPKHKIKYIDNANRLLAKINQYKDYSKDASPLIASNSDFE